jgi:hypothetical protein
MPATTHGPILVFVAHWSIFKVLAIIRIRVHGGHAGTLRELMKKEKRRKRKRETETEREREEKEEMNERG